ncbi:MAG: hypothetical protein WHV66_00465 [Anaerolineales bacterium]|jgi:hypothetical protein
MSPDRRKRASAFEDFPVEEAPIPTGEKQFSPVTARVETLQQVERIERLKPSQMLPDRFQPRRLLPAVLRINFFSGKLDCYQTAAEWINLSKNDPGMRAEIERLLAMGNSFDEHGQIKPITGSWLPTQDGHYIFQIETGERRFWAACLRAVNEKLEEEPLLRVEVVEKPTRQRQVLENRHAEPPSAVGQACEIAALILSELGIQPDPTLSDEYDYFRQARLQRMPAGMWERIMPIMQLTRPRMVQLLNILQMPTPLLELADRYRLSERVLREILASPREGWERMLRLSIQNNLTSDEVAEITTATKQGGTETGRKHFLSTAPSAKVAVGGLRRFANALLHLDKFSQAQAMDEIADDLVSAGEAEGIMLFLEDLARAINARLSRR